MKLKAYARRRGVSYGTAWGWWKAGKLPGRQMDTGTILVETAPASASTPSQRVAIYARVSSAENKGNLGNLSNLQSQAERFAAYCAPRGYQVAKLGTEAGSGVSEVRPRPLALLDVECLELMMWGHQERL